MTAARVSRSEDRDRITRLEVALEALPDRIEGAIRRAMAALVDREDHDRLAERVSSLEAGRASAQALAEAFERIRELETRYAETRAKGELSARFFSSAQEWARTVLPWIAIGLSALVATGKI